jgi:hypothetical protein
VWGNQDLLHRAIADLDGLNHASSEQRLAGRMHPPMMTLVAREQSPLFGVC